MAIMKIEAFNARYLDVRLILSLSCLRIKIIKINKEEYKYTLCYIMIAHTFAHQLRVCEMNPPMYSSL